MRLLRVEIDHFKNILNSGSIGIQQDVTCVVGKNESGKTAVLQSLHRFNPAQPNAKFNAQRQYPAWLEKQHRRQGNIDEHSPVNAVFKIEKADIEAVEQRLGLNALRSEEISVSRTYQNKFRWDAQINERAVVSHIVGDALPHGSPVPMHLAELDELINNLGTVIHDDEAETIAARELGKKLGARRGVVLGNNKNISAALWDVVSSRIPKFFYFDDYSQLPGSVKIRELLSKDKGDLTPSETTARALLDLGGADNDYLLNPDYETRKRELENIANSITHQVLAYWSTNPELRTDSTSR